MKFQFSIPDTAAADFDYLVQHAPFVGLTPRLLTINLIVQAAKAHKQGLVAAQPKQPAHRETAEERTKREQAEYRERKLEEYRSTGDWPKVDRRAKGSGHKEGSANIYEGRIMFTKPGEPGKLMGWTPPEDYPYMEDYRKAQREVEQMDMPPVDQNRPKPEDYETDEEFYDAENLYERTVVRDAIDAMPDLPPPVKSVPIVPARNLEEELQSLLDAG